MHAKNGLDGRARSAESGGMPPREDSSKAKIEIRSVSGGTEVILSGEWRLEEPRPSASRVWVDLGASRLVLRTEGLLVWDSSLLLFIDELQGQASQKGVTVDLSLLPERMRALYEGLTRSDEKAVARERGDNLLSVIGIATIYAQQQLGEILRFVGECVLSAGRILASPRRFRWRDCGEEMQRCGAMALPIVSLISFLVGVTLAYTAAIVLRQFGGDIWVSDLVGLSMTREMGAMMTGVVLAGRTGAAFAAQIGNMGANEEIDALETLGIAPVDFLVVPRIVALGLMMPLLTLYANALGIVGGMVVARGVLDIPPTAYWVELLSIVDLSDLSVGLIKATTFGMIIGMAGCLRGLQAERSAAGVGQAATSAVVTSILFIIIGDAAYAVVFHILGL